MQYLLNVIVGIAISFVALVQIGYACSCGHPKDHNTENGARRFFNSEFQGNAFAGTIISIKTVPSMPSEFLDEIREVTIEVDEFWRGKVEKRTVVYTGIHDGACGVEFKIGKRYFFTPSGKSLRPQVGICDYFSGMALDDDPKTRKLIERLLGKSTKIIPANSKQK